MPSGTCSLYSVETMNSQEAMDYRSNVSYDLYMRDCDISSDVILSTITPPTITSQTDTVLSYCTTNTECEPVVDAECREATCQCIKGLSYDPASHACVTGTS